MAQAPLIAPFITGLQHNKESWLCAPDSFQEMRNARIEHGYVSVGRGFYLKTKIPTSLPITGITSYRVSLTLKETLVWDTENLWKFNDQITQPTRVNQTSLFSQGFFFIKSVSFLGAQGVSQLFFTSGYPLDKGKEGLWFYQSPQTLTSFSPTTDSSTIVGAKALGVLRGRLLLFGTYEEINNVITYFPSRVRWSAIGQAEVFEEKSGGGYADAAVTEEIIGVESLQNIMVVVFESGLWALDSTWDPQRPFVWRRSDDNVRCFNEKSLIPSPLDVKIVGSRGIVATDSRQVERIDTLIPQYIAKNMDYSKREQFFGFREYTYQTLWYIYVYSGTQNEESSEEFLALIRDEVSLAFSTYQVPFNILGYGYSSFSYRCSDFTLSNNTYWTVSSQIGKRIKDYRSLGSETLLGGDPKGGVYVIDEGYFKGYSQQAILHTADWNPYVTEGKQSRFLYLDVFIEALENQVMTISFFKDNTPTPYKTTSVNMLPYLGVIGNITQVIAGETTQLIVPNHGLSQPTPIYIYEAEGMNNLNSLEGILAFPENDMTLRIAVNSLDWGVYTGGGIISLKPFSRTKTWKRIYAGGTGFTHSVRISFKGRETTYFKLHALKPYFVPRGKRLI